MRYLPHYPVGDRLDEITICGNCRRGVLSSGTRHQGRKDAFMHVATHMWAVTTQICKRSDQLVMEPNWLSSHLKLTTTCQVYDRFKTLNIMKHKFKQKDGHMRKREAEKKRVVWGGKQFEAMTQSRFSSRSLEKLCLPATATAHCPLQITRDRFARPSKPTPKDPALANMLAKKWLFCRLLEVTCRAAGTNGKVKRPPEGPPT